MLIVKEPLKSVILKRFHRIISIEQRTLAQNEKKEFTPLLTRGQIIECDFVGQGSTLDNRHFAIVWSADRKSEHIVLIPLTSKNRDGIAAPFSLGVIDGLDAPGREKESIAKVNQPQSISRKSVHIKKRADGSQEPVKLNESQMTKLIDIFRKYHLKEPHLNEVLEKRIGFKLPTTPLSAYIDLLHRPVQYFVQNENQLWCKAHDDNSWIVIEIVKVSGINTAKRKELLYFLFAGKENDYKSIMNELISVQEAAAAKDVT